LSKEIFKDHKDMKILVVDDLFTMRDLMSKSLNQLGFFNIQQATDGDMALQFLLKEKFDLLITDWQMPNMSGIDLIKAVRSNEKIKSIKILMVTIQSEKDQIAEAISAGVDGYLLKPFTLKILEDNLVVLL
jgi:two-component system chemotaxis response regulator CheY